MVAHGFGNEVEVVLAGTLSSRHHLVGRKPRWLDHHLVHRHQTVRWRVRSRGEGISRGSLCPSADGLAWMLHAGGRRLEDLRELRAEQEVLGKLGLEAVPDAGAVGDWLPRQGPPGAEAIQQVSRRLGEACLQSEAEEVILDVDAKVINYYSQPGRRIGT